MAGVATRSIIPVKGNRPAEKDDDGVVACESAHLACADSELVLHGPHSCQSKPAAIAEVRRILLQYLAGIDSRPP